MVRVLPNTVPASSWDTTAAVANTALSIAEVERLSLKGILSGQEPSMPRALHFARTTKILHPMVSPVLPFCRQYLESAGSIPRRFRLLPLEDEWALFITCMPGFVHGTASAGASDMIGNYLQANGLASVVEKCHCGGELYQPDIRLLIMIIKLIDYFTLKLG